MKKEVYAHGDMPGYRYTLVTLESGERHAWFEFSSAGPGHVVIRETPFMDDWTEYDLNDPEFLAKRRELVAKGWKAAEDAA